MDWTEKLTALIMLVVALAFVAFVAASLLGGFYPNYSGGYRVGMVQKMSNKGLFCKSMEGELVLDSFRGRTRPGEGNNYAVDNIWTFSTADPQILDALNTHAGQRVKLTYRQWFIKPFCHFTDYEIVKVEPAS